MRFYSYGDSIGVLRGKNEEGNVLTAAQKTRETQAKCLLKVTSVINI